jgi:CHAD domain-containing protein
MAKKAHLRWDDAAGAAVNARAQLPLLAAAYFKAGRKLAKGSPTPDELHAFRLKTKRLRYTLELFRGCYGPSLEQRLESLRRVQSLLGDVNDCVAAGRISAKALSPRSPHFRKIDRFLQARTIRLSAQFHRFWSREFDAPGREDWWIRYLALPAR